jgi:hypothetical protein
VRIVAVATLHQSGIDAVTIGPRELRLLRSMASIAQLRLWLYEHKIHVPGHVRAVTRNATHALRQMLGPREILGFQTGLVAPGADGR